LEKHSKTVLMTRVAAGKNNTVCDKSVSNEELF